MTGESSPVIGVAGNPRHASPGQRDAAATPARCALRALRSRGALRCTAPPASRPAYSPNHTACSFQVALAQGSKPIRCATCSCRAPGHTRLSHPPAFLAPRIEPSTAYTDPPGEFLFEIAGAGRPAYLRRTSAGYSIGWVGAFGGFSYLGQLRTDAAGNPAGVDYESGCASTRVRADALQIGHQVLRAYSSGREYGTCLNDDGIPGPGVRLQIDVVGPDDFVVQGEERILEEPIAFVALLPRGSDGAWLVHRTDGSTSFAPPPLVAVPLDSGGRIVGEQIELFESSFSAPPVAVAPFGAGFAAAWIEMGETSAVAVRTFGAAGQPLAAGGFNAEPIDSGDRLSLLASDDADALLVGWTHWGDRVHVTRLRCVDGR